ncbi:MAG: hypothetical protein ABI467_21825 [Kofleriaceae bacterium]
MEDTNPKVVEIQRDLLRKAGAGKRAALAVSLSSSVIELSRRELRRLDRAASDTELALKWVEQNYGLDLAQRVRRYLAVRGG